MACFNSHYGKGNTRAGASLLRSRLDVRSVSSEGRLTREDLPREIEGRCQITKCATHLSLSARRGKVESVSADGRNQRGCVTRFSHSRETVTIRFSLFPPPSEDRKKALVDNLSKTRASSGYFFFPPLVHPRNGGFLFRAGESIEFFILSFPYIPPVYFIHSSRIIPIRVDIGIPPDLLTVVRGAEPGHFHVCHI